MTAARRCELLHRTSLSLLLLLLLQQPPRHTRHDACNALILMVARMFGVLAEKVHDILHAQLADRLAAALDGRVCKVALLGLQFEDALFDAVGDCEAVNYYVLRLVEAVDSIDCLFFDEL